MENFIKIVLILKIKNLFKNRNIIKNDIKNYDNLIKKYSTENDLNQWTSSKLVEASKLVF